MVKLSEEKLCQLKQFKTLNIHPELVKDELFISNYFFDPNDFMQVKYEMLRHIITDHWSIIKATTNFGISRPTCYKLNNNFQKYGLNALLTNKRGPKTNSKLTPEIIDFIKYQKEKQKLTWNEIIKVIKNTFNVNLHLRTVQQITNLFVKKNHYH